MHTFPDYGAVRYVLADLVARLDPNAAPVPPSLWDRCRMRLRELF
jgi:hypothetical protein